MTELWDCYDKDFQLVPGKVLDREQIARFSADEYHLVCDVAVKHSDGSYLLMQRDPCKNVHPGEWEFTAGGSALRGESPLECAKRELLEETGLIADQMTELGRMTVARSHSHYVLYLAIFSGDKASVTLQVGETVAYQWTDIQDIQSRRAELATWRMFEVLPGPECL